MTPNEIIKKFPVGSHVKIKSRISTIDDVDFGMVYDASDEYYEGKVHVACFVNGNFGHIRPFFVDQLEPYGDIEAIETLIDFAGRLLETDLGRPDRERLEKAISILEEVYGI